MNLSFSFKSQTPLRTGLSQTPWMKLIPDSVKSPRKDPTQTAPHPLPSIPSSTTTKSEKEEFRDICASLLSYIRYISLPPIQKQTKWEAVLIEYRMFPHMEFLIRNTILKMGPMWCHAIVCGNLNYDFIRTMCSEISPNINIIKTSYDNLNQSTYSELLATATFWEQFGGEKILLYQEDSCVFHSNIEPFMEWDYIGAPWPLHQNDSPNGVGNGGFSLRTKQCMVDVCNQFSIDLISLNSSTIDYMKLYNLNVCPEDVFFSKTMQDHGIGRVAPWDIARSFSTETINNPSSFGGHNFWLSDPNWRERIYKLLPTFRLYNEMITDHRGGWNTVISGLKHIGFLNNQSPNLFLDMIERYFIWERRKEIKKPWSGFIHCTPNTPSFLNLSNIQQLFKNQQFILSLYYCKSIFTLCHYITEYLKREFVKLNVIIPVYTLKHPTDTNNLKVFNMENYLTNNNKKILQVGCQLRKVSSIFIMEDRPLNHEKLWLTGRRDIASCINTLKQELDYLNKKITQQQYDAVKILYTSDQEYDELLSQNIVFIDLFDAAANNTVVECIIRNTPIICNKVGGIVDYLGENYPLYFETIDEIPSLLNTTMIQRAYDYLLKINKHDYYIDTFNRNIINLG